MATPKKKDKFPLWLHPSGQWCKKHNRTFYYFGIHKDAALKRFANEWEDIKAGRAPRRDSGTAVILADVANKFLAAKRDRVDIGEMSARTWGEYFHICDRIVTALGRNRVVATLRPEDFGKLRTAAGRKLGPVALSKFITMTRTVFAWAFKTELLEAPPRYGEEFDKPDRSIMRRERQRRGPKLISAADVWKLLDHAEPQLRAMLLLGLNCGYGAKDCSDLQRAALTVRPGWLTVPRSKTWINRTCPLWPETIAALQEVAKMRPEPNDPADHDCVFITMHGNRWCRHLRRYKEDGTERRGTSVDSVMQMFRLLRKRAGVKVPGGPYVMRHIFRTVADETKDRPATDLIMGHADHSQANYYREQIADERLTAVTNHVRDWFLAGKPRAVKAPAVLPFIPTAVG